MIDDSSERCVVLHRKVQQARKAHRCDECARTINVGERYTNEGLLFDGLTSTHKTCSHCIVCREWLGDECGGWLYSGVEEDFMEHAHEGTYGMPVLRLAVGIKNQWITRKGNLMSVPKCPLTTHAAHV
jgi:hypothetical protein